MYVCIFLSAVSTGWVMHLNVGLYLEQTACLLWIPLERNFSIQKCHCSTFIFLFTMLFNRSLTIVTAQCRFTWLAMICL